MTTFLHLGVIIAGLFASSTAAWAQDFNAAPPMLQGKFPPSKTRPVPPS